jgi:formiminoglutamase
MMFLRVGKIREHVFEAEPYLREAAMVTYNINAIRYSDAPGQPDPSPNGLFGDEACGYGKVFRHERPINEYWFL